MLWKRTDKESLEYARIIINAVCELWIALNQDVRVVRAEQKWKL